MIKIIIDCNNLNEKGISKLENYIFNMLDVTKMDVYVKVRRAK